MNSGRYCCVCPDTQFLISRRVVIDIAWPGQWCHQVLTSSLQAHHGTSTGTVPTCRILPPETSRPGLSRGKGRVKNLSLQGRRVAVLLVRSEWDAMMHDVDNRWFSTTRYRANPDRCTFYTMQSYFKAETESGVEGQDAACSNMPLSQVVLDNKATQGRDCKLLTCSAAKLGDGNSTGLHFDVKCFDNLPPIPGTPEGGPGWYLIEDTWYTRGCKESGLSSNQRVATKDGQCLLNVLSNDGTFIRLDLERLVRNYYGAGDDQCRNLVRTESLRELLADGDSACREKYVCGGTTMYDRGSNDPSAATKLDCATHFVSFRLERNSARRQSSCMPLTLVTIALAMILQ
jgi:hypothetical protein